MIFDKFNLLLLIIIIGLIINLLNIKFEDFNTSSNIKIINNENNDDIPSLINNPVGNYQTYCTDLIYDVKNNILTGNCEDKKYLNIKYNFNKDNTICKMLNYSVNKHEFYCNSY